MTVTVPEHNNSPYSFANPLLAQTEACPSRSTRRMLDHVDLISGRGHRVWACPDGIRDVRHGRERHRAGGGRGRSGSSVYNANMSVAQVPMTVDDQEGSWQRRVSR
jgi:hypothetical protein